jgi:hypothetical protein
MGRKQDQANASRFSRSAWVGITQALQLHHERSGVLVGMALLLALADTVIESWIIRTA